jgi:beta-glucanase (GH16 family)
MNQTRAHACAVSTFFFACCLLWWRADAAVAQPPSGAERREWVQLFNGRNLDGWDVKIAGHELNDNFGDTFRVEGGLLKVAYDKYDHFGDRFGHLFYRRKFSHYVVAVEYRFVGGQAPGGPAWARRNSGVMVHSQPAASMGLRQDFPVSIEVQLLGGLGEGRRTTANLCTPGTHVEVNGKLHTEHCTNSASETYDGDRWVRVEVTVLGHEQIKHAVEGKTVLSYEKPQVGGGVVSNYLPEMKKDGAPLGEGYIALQSESHPVEFRKVELLNLVGCTDPKAANYKSYYVKSDNSTCRYPRGRARQGANGGRVGRAGPPPAGWKLVWADEFDRDGRPDPKSWGYESGFVRNRELQWYQPENARCEGGLLVIEARRERRRNPDYKPQGGDWKGGREHADYTSASLTTKGRRQWRYGRFEMRGRIDTRPGLWPAFWTLGVEGEWPGNGEIDIMEYYRGMLLANVAWAGAKRWVAQWDTFKKPISEFNDPAWSQKFHTWRMDWDEQAIRLYVDDELLNTTSLGDTVNKSPDGRNPFHQPHYLLLNLAVGGTNSGDPSGTDFPARFEVDYVRVYQKSASQ